MASPEVELPRIEDLSRLRFANSPESPTYSCGTSHISTSQEKDVEKWDLEDQDRSGQMNESPIVHHYLTFETELPSPTTLQRPEKDAPPSPEAPDLKRYQSPFDWPQPLKNFITWVAVVSTASAAYAAGSYAPGVGQMSEEWHVSNVAVYVGITIFTCGFAVAPMILAPLSEINGRKPVFIATGILFVVCQLCCAVTRSYGGMLASRFFVGVGGSTFSTMVGGVVSDVFHAKDRNTPMALFAGSALFGTGLGPLTCGFLVEHTTWRWIFYLQLIVDAVIVLVVAVFLKETRGSVLLSRKAAKLNKWYEAREQAGYYEMDMVLDTTNPSQKTPQRIRWKVKADEERVSLAQMLRISLIRPFHLLLTEPVVFWFSCWVSFSWAILYLTLAAIPLVFQNLYGFTLAQANSVFAAMMVGSIIASLLSVYQEQWYDAWVIQRKNNPPRNRIGRFLATHSESPERRLYFACVDSLFLVIGLFMFGWTAVPNIHWIVPSIAIAFATIGIFSIYLAVFNYLADAYVQYASSALAAQSFCRNLLGGSFPLVTRQMYNNMGYPQASSMLGAIGAALTIVPWILVIYGPKIRARSKFAAALA